ncbi:VgrG-related protein [Streptomyces sp. SL13]|uniref:VgrG-related protein n=1 Tax=Streptantibioticus silvisoli TaxID=2705255 RepID=A0AA90HAB1_9ACTN|nr:VgrG-related protein [Streptantibioticus silvisoli]MDI5970972.1 VgrG-related protein [Streptantibioticus silvisoli]
MTTAEARGGRAFAADPVVEAPGPLPTAWANQLVGCDVDSSVGLPDTAVLTYRDPYHGMLAATGITIGTRLTVSVVTVQGNTRVQLFTGEVTALELDMDGTGSFTVVRASARTHRLTRGRKVAAFRNMTTGDIVRKVAAGAGLACGRVDSFSVVHQQLSQANVSDWEFLQYLARECGAQLRCDDEGLLEFTAPQPASSAPDPATPAPQNPLVLEYGRNLLELRGVLTGADGAGTVEARGWDVATKRPLTASAPAVRSTTALPGLAPLTAAAAFGAAARLTVTDSPYRTQAETTAVAGAVAAGVAAGFAELEAVAEGNPHLRAGVPAALGNVGPAFSGRYTVTSVRHVVEPHRGYRTTVTVSASPDRSLTGLVTGANAAARGARMPGLAVGVVTDIREPGGADRGWVRLRFPWLDDDYVSDWARTVQWGGTKGGGVFGPEVNDEVLVGFEQGSLDSPYVLGGLYNGVDHPSAHDVRLVGDGGTANRRSLVCRSGHRLELLEDSGPGRAGVRLASGDGRLEVRLDHGGGSISLTVLDAAGGQVGAVQLSRSGITLDAGTGTVRLKGTNVELDAAVGTVSVNAGTVTLDGGVLNLRGKTSAGLQAPVVRIN